MNQTFGVCNHQSKFLTSDAKFPSLVTGYGGGKTVAFVLKALEECGRNAGKTILLAEPVFPMVRDVLQPTLESVLRQLKFDYEYRASDLQYIVKWKGGWAKILLRSAENWRRWAGLNLAGGGIDEAGLLKDDGAWKMLLSRLREGEHLCAWTTTTPEGFNWHYEHWGEGKTTEYELIQGKTTDNPYLPQEFIDSLIANYDDHLIRAYLNGEYVNLQHGATFYNFEREKHVCEEAIYNENLPIRIMLDFNVDPMCGSIWQKYHNGQTKGMVIDEIKLRHSGGNELLTELFANEVKRRFPKCNRFIVYPDPSGNQRKTSAFMTDHDILRQAGFELRVKRTAPSVVDRVNATNRSFGFFKIHPQCKDLIKDFEQVVNKEGTREIDKSNKSLTHFCDGYGYAIDYEYPIQKPSTKTFMG